MTRLALALLLGLAPGCAAPISTQAREPQSPLTLRKVVLLPFASDPAPGGSVEADAAAIVTTRMLEAMTQETELEIVPPGEAARVPSVDGMANGEELHRQFGIDAVLRGVVRRYVERSGGPGGSSRPAAVWFSLELRTPSGVLLWSATYDETQAALTDDLGSFGRAWQRGFRWVTAADLAGYGARELARALALDTGTWS